MTINEAIVGVPATDTVSNLERRVRELEEKLRSQSERWGRDIIKRQEAEDRVRELEAELARVAPFLAAHGFAGYRLEKTP